ncbi:MAG: hypothetical protein U1C56_01185, partial [Candidatus Curtissbacteria bacterium]|nr:hypothetical protein [Candidatus Curtissbacteria bacterium]
ALSLPFNLKGVPRLWKGLTVHETITSSFFASAALALNEVGSNLLTPELSEWGPRVLFPFVVYHGMRLSLQRHSQQVGFSTKFAIGMGAAIMSGVSALELAQTQVNFLGEGDPRHIVAAGAGTLLAIALSGFSFANKRETKNRT